MKNGYVYSQYCVGKIQSHKRGIKEDLSLYKLEWAEPMLNLKHGYLIRSQRLDGRGHSKYQDKWFISQYSCIHLITVLLYRSCWWSQTPWVSLGMVWIGICKTEVGFIQSVWNAIHSFPNQNCFTYAVGHTRYYAYGIWQKKVRRNITGVHRGKESRITRIW